MLLTRLPCVAPCAVLCRLGNPQSHFTAWEPPKPFYGLGTPQNHFTAWDPPKPFYGLVNGSVLQRVGATRCMHGDALGLDMNEPHMVAHSNAFRRLVAAALKRPWATTAPKPPWQANAPQTVVAGQKPQKCPWDAIAPKTALGGTSPKTALGDQSPRNGTDRPKPQKRPWETLAMTLGGHNPDTTQKQPWEVTAPQTPLGGQSPRNGTGRPQQWPLGGWPDGAGRQNYRK